MLVARHTLQMFGDIISDKMITTRSVPPELQPKVEAARIDLFESGKYGKIGIQETDLYLEDFIEKIKTQDRINGPYDIIIKVNSDFSVYEVEEEKREQEAANAENGGNSSLITDVTTGVQ